MACRRRDQLQHVNALNERVHARNERASVDDVARTFACVLQLFLSLSRQFSVRRSLRLLQFAPAPCELRFVEADSLSVSRLAQRTTTGSWLVPLVGSVPSSERAAAWPVRSIVPTALRFRRSARYPSTVLLCRSDGRFDWPFWARKTSEFRRRRSRAAPKLADRRAGLVPLSSL
jgi:hypothetical protein